MRTYFRTLAVIAFVPVCLSVARAQDGTAGPVRGAFQSKLSALHIKGSHLVDALGAEKSLHGINLGGWLVTEAWMCGFNDSQDTPTTSGSGGISGRSTQDDLETRFGAERAAALINIWQDHWITPEDLDQIRDSGFNLIRVPISYRTLQQADGTWILNSNGQIDFKRMDWIVSEAADRGIYTIFDLHVWPEQRLSSDKIGRPEGEKIRASMSQLWAAIAAHYRGNGAIAAFDLINEFPGNWGVQQVLSQAVTQADPDRIQVIEGFTYPEFMKLHESGVFPNSVFSEHLYGDKPLSTEEIKSRLKETVGSPVPIYVGEFLAADFASATQAMNALDIAWSSWTYKAVDMGDWAVFNYYSDLKTDIQKDSFQSIDLKWSIDLTSWRIPGADPNYVLNKNRRVISSSSDSALLEK